MTKVDLYDRASGSELPLYNVQSIRNDRQGSVNSTPFIGDDSEETFVTSLENGQSFDIQGVTTAQRLSRLGAWPSDPQQARAEWIAELDSFVNGAPGSGYELRRDYRSDSFVGVPEDVTWTVRGGEAFEVGYTVQFRVGDPVGLSAGTNPTTGTHGGDIKVDGTTVPTFREFQSQKSQNLTVARRAFASDPSENDITTDSGVTRTVRIVGEIEGTESERNTFDSNLAGSIGQDTIIDVEDPFTGRTYSGVVRSYESTDEAGVTRLGEFGVEVVEGSK